MQYDLMKLKIIFKEVLFLTTKNSSLISNNIKLNLIFFNSSTLRLEPTTQANYTNLSI